MVGSTQTPQVRSMVGAGPARRWIELDVRGQILRASPEVIGALGRSYLTETASFDQDPIMLDFSVEAVKLLLEALTLAKHQMLEDALQLLHGALRPNARSSGSATIGTGADIRALLEFINLGWVIGVSSSFEIPSTQEIDALCGNWSQDPWWCMDG